MAIFKSPSTPFAPHLFLSLDKQGQMTIYQTGGNPYGHIIQPQAIEDACAQLASFGLSAHLLVDLSHGNSQKNSVYTSWTSRALSANCCAPAAGRWWASWPESNLVAGNQNLG